MRALAPHWGALLALALFLAAGLAVLDDYGVILDAPWQRRNAEINLDYLAGNDFLAYPAAFKVDHDKFYGMAFEVPLLLAERVLGIEGHRSIFLSRHLITHLLFLIGGLFAYLLALRLFGGRLLAVAAMLLFLLHPRLYAHSFFNPKDLPFFAMFMAALFLTHRAFKRDSVSAFVPLGLAVGVLVNLRIMGVVLLAAVPAMRALDLAFASGWAERKRALLTSGAFALAGGLAIYALMPYLWGDPVGRAVEWWATLSNHPVVLIEPFRGMLYRSVDVPVEYLPVWLSITSPPFALLLGAVGVGGVLVAAARSPREALRSGSLRFALLLAGCFAAPMFAVMALGGNIYHGWRQMYFLWAPFALLAAFGLQWLVFALGRRRWRAAAYGAAGAGLAAAVISMALLHPNQQEHFNVLVDRVTPEGLRSQYRMHYWAHPMRQGIEWISEHSTQSSGEPRWITARWSKDSTVARNRLILPESARARLANAPLFDVVMSYPTREPWSPSARELHRLEVYGSALWVVESRGDLKEVYESVRGREPLIDGAFDVHRIDGALALVMEPCAPAFIKRLSVTLRAFPAEAGDLPEWREGSAFEPRHFELSRFGAYFEGKCVALLPLPAYPLADFELLWSLELLADGLLADGEAREKARRAREDGRMLARAAHGAAYDVYLADGELAYLNDACDPAETAHPFHLNVYPERVDDLPEERREQGFERFHFEFLLNGAFVDGGCAAFFSLPDYPVIAIRTGQYDADGGNLWSAEFLLDPERRLAELLFGASEEPVARGEFDVHLADGALIYLKEPCAREDTEARVFLHIMPERVDDLPEERRVYGFDNLDFNFFPRRGALFDGRCAARAALPEYPIASVRTGQYEGEEAIWVAEFLLDPERRLAELLSGASEEPVARGEFDVHLADGALVYVKEPCAPADTEARFFLHIMPERAGDLPEERRARGFDDLEFDFFLNGALFEERCAARAALPDYPVVAIRTGQRDAEGGDSWLAEFWIDPERRLAESTSGASGEPIAWGDFDVHLADGALVYVKEPCAPADTEARFFLHVTPERAGDLPEERRQYGFDNLDFNFFPRRGALFDGRCAARAALPEYPIASIRTGQYNEDGAIWSAEFGVGR